MNSAQPGPAASDAIRVMVVDDSAVVRGLITRMLEGDKSVQVVASVGNGQMAVNALDRHDIEVVVLDIEMPVMDGLTALPQMLAKDPRLQVIMASTLTLRNADISLKALEAGAADYIPKPTSTRDITGASNFKAELVNKVKALGNVRRQKAGARPASPAARAPGARPAPARAPVPVQPAGATRATGPVTLRSPSTEPMGVLAIGSSTGGPQALFTVLGGLKGTSLGVPILITQHMPATFTAILAEHITRLTGWPAAEGVDGQPVLADHAYVAPGDFHMVVEAQGQQKVIRLTKTPPENFCRPSVDPMLRSVAQVWGRRAFVVILTGMGSDGMKGAEVVVRAGGTVVAQDEATSVVWGMPGAVATAGLCSAVLPLPQIAPHIRKTATRRG